MPTIFTKEGFRFFFHSNEHRPIHVHVRKGCGRSSLRPEIRCGAARVRRLETPGASTRGGARSRESRRHPTELV
ncbi:MAG TPA: DUF4160 domain-containing protein [Thermoanaerobaculia bacterium]|nr:DUF4160 domain-containing protein [Thermoanaerobaculia bacterium]